MIFNTGSLQLYYDINGDPIELPHNCAAIGSKEKFKHLRSIEEIQNCRSLIDKFNKIFIVRTYALGDILMAIPVGYELKERYPDKEFYFCTSSGFAGGVLPRLMENAYTRIIDRGILASRLEKDSDSVGIILDGVVELDHQGGEESSLHRVDIYRKFIGLPTIGKSPIWSTKPRYAGTHGVVFSSGGSNSLKQLPPDTANYVVKQLERRFNKIVHINHNKLISAENFIETIRDARVLITMDSAALWVAHFTATPVVLILGPTREAERLSYHPLYPDGATSFSLSGEIGCEPCLHSRKTCGGSVNCMRHDKHRVWELVEQGIEKVMWKTKERD